MMIDCLIVGQGIAGSVLAWQLLRADQRILVINNKLTNQASSVAAGLYNPMTGRSIVKTWMADVLFPYLVNFYQDLELILATPLLHPWPLLRPFANLQEREQWIARSPEGQYAPFVKVVDEHYQAAEVFNQYGGVVIKQAGYLDVPRFLEATCAYLQARNLYREADFKHEALHLGEFVSYQGIQARRIIFCEGPQAKHNPFFSYLPFRLVKGELIWVKLPKPLAIMYNRGVFVLPRAASQAVVGASYDWHDLTLNPTEKARRVLEERLQKLLRLPYGVLKQRAGIRPATFDRRPWIGLHPQYPQVGIFNGLGTKGVSLAPYLAAAFVNHLLYQEELPAAVQLHRASKLAYNTSLGVLY